MTSREIRQQFLDFFRGKDHAVVPSAPVVPVDDPTLMFTNAGMNQFKDVFLATGTRPYNRAADTQKCIRAGGKHNDLDDVGQDTYHHTFFEMLGNWSFGDYFKAEAIQWAWELLTDVWGIDKARLHATYFEGDAAEGLEPDDESARLWREVTDIHPDNVHPGGRKDNFWEMGDTGPCGPCSEIHIDLTPDKSGRALVNAGDPRVIELWNLVFIQFNRGGDGKLTPLPANHVDTGMGFERLCAVLQGKLSNYDTDVWTPVFAAVQKRTGAPAYRGTLPKTEPRPSGSGQETATKRESAETEPRPSGSGQETTTKRESAEAEPRPSGSGQDGATKSRSSEAPIAPDEPRPSGSGPDDAQIMIDVSYRVIADHVRCLTFALTDGGVPGNEGRGYVMRRILRRAVRYGRQYLDMHEPFLCDLVPVVVDHMADAFPELRTAHGGNNVRHVIDLIRDEEASFLKTLDRGIKLFEHAALKAIGRAMASDRGTKLVLVGARGGRHVGSSDSLDTDQLIETYTYFFEEGEPYDFPRSALQQVRQSVYTVPDISGEDAFKLHDTYGFPIDLTELMAEERGLTVNIGEYERLMEQARERARGAAKSAPTATAHHPADATDDSFKYDDKYVDTPLQANIQAIAFTTGEHAPVEPGMVFRKGDRVQLWLTRTCFYAHQGGQVGDRGYISSDTGRFRVESTQWAGVAIAHIGYVEEGEVQVGQDVDLAVDESRRATTRNHTATHMLNWALREVLGPGVQQKGSLVDPEKTRFDFSHNKPVTPDELARVESLVNRQIEADHPVYTKEVEEAKARTINTLRAVFGEKYPDRVRVVSVGADIDAMLRTPTDDKWTQYAVEFCGGTHLTSSGEAERFVLLAEEGVAKGVRRVVGVTGDAARRAEWAGGELLDRLTGLASEPPGELAEQLTAFQREVTGADIPVCVRHELQRRIADLQKRVKQAQKQRAAASGEAVMDRVAWLLESAETTGGVTVVVGEVPTAGPDALRGAIDWIRNKTQASAVLLATTDEGKVTLIAGMSRDVVAKGVKAGDLIKRVAPLVGGRGGGRPDMAQGGGNRPDAVPRALDQAKVWIAGELA